MNSQNEIILMINKRSIIIVILAAFFLELIIILYNNLIGFINIENVAEFFLRWLYGTFFASIAAIYLFVLNVKFLNRLNRKLPWNYKYLKRFLAEGIYTLIIGISGSVLITVIVELISPYKESFLWILFVNSIVAIVINIIFVIILEALHYYKKSMEEKIINKILEKENAVIKLETLKSQLNPHFLFNSLNVLSSLIKKDADQAQNFVDEFSHVYRYTLEVIDRSVVLLKEEMNFVKSYFYMQKIRFGDSVQLYTNINAEKLEYFIPPLSIQTLLENAFKHNKASNDRPLIINIFNKENKLFISNTYNAKVSNNHSKGIGLTNLKKRYQLICGEEPTFEIIGNEFIAVIPIVESG